MFTIVDRYGQRTQFAGIHLSHASSWRPLSSRWADLDIYRTAAGSYIIAQTGQSAVYHVDGCPDVRRNAKAGVMAMLTERDIPCKCVQHTSPRTKVFWEIPLTTVQVANTAAAAVACLTRTDSHGVQYMTDTARALLAEAANIDEDIHDAISSRFIA